MTRDADPNLRNGRRECIAPPPASTSRFKHRAAIDVPLNAIAIRKRAA